MMRFKSKIQNSISNILKLTSFWQNNSFLLRDFKYFGKMAILSIIFSVIAAAFEGFGVSFILFFLKNLTDPYATPIQTGFSWFDVWILGITSPAFERLYRVCGLIMLASWLRIGFNFLSQVCSKISQFSLLDRLRKQLFEQFQRLSLNYFYQTNYGDLVHIITIETYQVYQAFDVMTSLVYQGIILMTYLILMSLLSWQLSLISVMLFIFLSLSLSALIKLMREASFEQSINGSHFTSVVVEFLNGIRIVHAFATQEFERKKFYRVSTELKNSFTKLILLSELTNKLAEVAANTFFVGIIILSFTIFIPNEKMQPASLLTFSFVFLRFMSGVRQVNGTRAMLSSFQGSINNIREVLRTDNKTYLRDGTVEFQGLKRSIEFISVDFEYEPHNLVLRDIQLTIERGQMTAIVGASGAGKTTLVDLVLRFYDPTQGKILLDGIKLSEFKINSLRRKIALVSQDTFIFNTSVQNNIAYGMEGADNGAIREAARLANALEFILEMPAGFDTLLGDRGVRLSGGQRQRIAIARALLCNPDILILDEATSALDSLSERLIQESLEKLSVGRTVIAIAHRLSTIIKADQVIVLKQGRIVEQGRYRELLERRGHLWRYHNTQYESGWQP